MNLFQYGNFTLHSGDESNFKIDCDALQDEDWACLARIIANKVAFSRVVGVPTGGCELARHLEPYKSSGPLLIVDDVLTTGASMERWRESDDDIGIVIFARKECPSWVYPLFRMEQYLGNKS